MSSLEKAIKHTQTFLLSNDYISNDMLFDITEQYDLSIADTEYYIEYIQRDGTLIKHNRQNENNEEIDYIGRSRFDYEELFITVLKEEPNLQQYIDYLRGIDAPQKGEENEMFVKAREGNAYAKERLISMFLKQSLKIAVSFVQKYDFPLYDTIQDANLGLIKAIEKMPNAIEYRFSTYFPWWVRQVVLRRNISLSSFYIPHQKRINIYKIIDLLNEIEDKEIDLYSFFEYIKKRNEMFVEIDLPEEEILNLLKVIVFFEYENNEFVDSDNNSFIDMLNESIENYYINKVINEQLSKLKDRNKGIIINRYGLNGTLSKTLEEVGLIYNLTRERIRQIEHNSLRELELHINNSLE